MAHRIPFNKPFVSGQELEYISQAVGRGELAADGHFTKACAALIKEQFGAHKVLMTPSCTAALEMAALLCDVGPGDEVIVPSYTFVSTVNAFVLRGARPVFVDIRPDTLNIDEAAIEGAITERTRAIVPVHYAGVGCAMDKILALAEARKILVVEDAAQGVHAYYRGRALGSIGQLGTYSFHDTKNYVCGEGGALLINDPALVERAEIIRDKGTNRARYFRGEVDKYTWVDLGSSYLPAELSCAFLLAQLERLDPIRDRRREVFERYDSDLAPLEERGLLRRPRVPAECQQNYHMYYVLLESARATDELAQHLRQRGIQVATHYVPLHLSPMGRQWGYKEGDLPRTEDLAVRLLRLPMNYYLTPEAQAEVTSSVRAFFGV